MTEALYWGLKFGELITTIGLILGPVVAVGLTLWIESRRRVREQQLTLLRMLIATHHLPSDPSYQIAINLIPIEFRGRQAVMTAHKEFIESVARQPDGVNDEKIFRDWGVKSVRLVHEVAKALKYDLRETDLQTAPYSSKGWADRDAILLDSQRAMRDIANMLMLQSRLLANVPLEPAERKLIGLHEVED